jgi:hypothetical protein
MTSALRGFVAVLVLTLQVLGCISKTNPVNLGPKTDVSYDRTRVRHVKARGCGFLLFPFNIPINTSRVYEKAYSALEREAPFEYLSEIEAQPYWRWVLVGNLQCVVLSATAYQMTDRTHPTGRVAPSAQDPVAPAIMESTEPVEPAMTRSMEPVEPVMTEPTEPMEPAAP